MWWQLLKIAGWGALGLLVALAAFVALLPWIVRPFLRLALMLRYDVRVLGHANLPRTGPVLLVSNHVTWFDGFFLASTIGRAGTALVNSGVFKAPMLGYLARRCGLLSIPYSGPRAQRAAIGEARKALDAGNLLGIFPEGQLTRNGMTGAFHRGLEVILDGRADVPVVPVFIENAWGSMLSYSGGRCLWKRPQGFRRTVVIAYGPPVDPPVDVFRVRQGVMEQGVVARKALSTSLRALETIDPALPHFETPELGPLAGSALDDSLGGAKQVGQKPGTVGHPLPGVSIRPVGPDGQPVGPDLDGDLQALTPALEGWRAVGRRGRVDRDGFVTLLD